MNGRNKQVNPISIKYLKKKINFHNIITVILLSIGTIFMFSPVLWMFSVAIQPSDQTFSLPPNWIPKEFSLENYRNLFASNVPIHRFTVNSLVVALVVTAGQLITGALAGYAFARLRFRGNKIIFITLLVSLMVPVHVTIIPIFRVMKALNLIDNPLSVILPFLSSIFAIFFMRQFFMTFPKVLIDAARIDGATHWKIFWKIAFPLSRPSLAALGVITFNNTWNEYFFSLVFLSSWEKMTLPVGMRAIGNLYQGSVATKMAAMSLVVAFVLIIFLIAQKHIVKGLTSGAVKG